MRTLALTAALLGSTAILRMMADGAAAGGDAAADTVLDPAPDLSTEPGGGPTNSPPPAPAVDAAPPAPAGAISLCRLVVLTFDASAPFDGDTTGVGIVVKVNDDGSANVKAFAPGGGADGFFTGVRNTDDVLAMPDGAEKNAALTCTWSFPTRITSV